MFGFRNSRAGFETTVKDESQHFFEVFNHTCAETIITVGHFVSEICNITFDLCKSAVLSLVWKCFTELTVLRAGFTVKHRTV